MIKTDAIAPHEMLLERWNNQHSHKGKLFISDGIIDPDRWNKDPHKPKVLLLLKEAYDKDKGAENWDLRKLIREEWKGPKTNLWWQAAYWCYAIHTGCTQEIPSYNETEKAAAREALLSSAIVNIKKSNGKTQSDDDDLASYVKEDGALLLEQINLINPDIIICGNVWRFIQKDLWPDATEVFDMVWKNDKRIFINYWHPANRYPHALNYYTLSFLLMNSGVL